MNLAELAGLERGKLIAALALAGPNVAGTSVRRVGGVALIATGLPSEAS